MSGLTTPYFRINSLFLSLISGKSNFSWSAQAFTAENVSVVVPNPPPPAPASVFWREVHSSLVQTLLNAPGRNARTTGPFFTSSLRRTVSRSWLTREKSGALAPTSIDIHVSFNGRSERSASTISPQAALRLAHGPPRAV